MFRMMTKNVSAVTRMNGILVPASATRDVPNMGRLIEDGRSLSR